MIIVEGTDGVGKTTFCKKLLTQLPCHVYSHFTRLPSGFDYHWGYSDRISRFVVQDRFHMSEIAYARARQVNPNLSEWDYGLVDAKLRLVGAVTVIINATDELIRSRWNPDQMYDADQTVIAARVFRQVMAGDYSYIDYDYQIECHKEKPYATDDDVGEVLELYRRRQLDLDRIAGRRKASL